GAAAMPLLVSVLRGARGAVVPALSALGRCLSRGAVQHRLLRAAHLDGGAGDGAEARRVRAHLRRRASLSQPSRAGAAAAVALAAILADHAAQSGCERFVCVPVRGLCPARVRSAPAHQSRGGGVTARASIATASSRSIPIV